VNINDVYPSKFLKTHDLKGTSPTVSIERVGVEQVRNRVKADTRVVLYFKGKTKGLLLNKTNAQTVAQIAGSPLTEQWAGVAVTLYVTTATFGAVVHDVIRIKAPAAGAAPVRRPIAAAPAILTDELEIDLQDGRAY
jgi:hypothetical protein